MKIADLNVTKEWQSLNELLANEKIKGIDSLKNYHLKNILSFPIQYIEAETKPSADEKGTILLGGACAGYAKTEGKELFLRHCLVGNYGDPAELPVALHDNTPLHHCVALGSYSPEASEDDTYLTREQAQVEFDKKADKTELNKKADKSELNDKADNIAVDALVARLGALEDRVSIMAKSNIEPVIAEVGQPLPEMKDDTKDYVISGAVSKSGNIVGKSVTLDSVAVTNGARLSLSASDVELKASEIVGDFPKAQSNAIMVMNATDYISIKDVIVNATTYNCIEIGNTAVVPRNILIENCQFKGEFANNAISIFGTQDNATININNCHFDSVSNILRLSNKTNAKNVVVNITNCSCDKWETTEYAGAIILQDYISKTAEEVKNNNFFGDGKITINISNLTTPSGKLSKPARVADICGTKTDFQVLYVYDSANGVRAYDSSVYPVINVN